MIDKRIAEVAKKVVARPEKIGELLKVGREVYFRAGSGVFSILADNPHTDGSPGYMFFFYPGYTGTLENLAANSEFLDSDELVRCESADASIEERRAFNDLYLLLEKKSDVVGPVLDKILRELD